MMRFSRSYLCAYRRKCASIAAAGRQPRDRRTKKKNVCVCVYEKKKKKKKEKAIALIRQVQTTIYYNSGERETRPRMRLHITHKNRLHPPQHDASAVVYCSLIRVVLSKNYANGISTFRSLCGGGKKIRVE